MRAPGVAADAMAATFTGVSVSPKRATARYIIRAEDAAQFNGLEPVLRADMRQVLGNLVDEQAINGDGKGANLAGFISHATAGAEPAATVVQVGEIDGYIAGGVDGLYTNDPSGVRFLIGTATEKALLIRRPFSAAGGSVQTMSGLFRASCGGVRATTRVAAVANNIQSAYRFVPNGLRFIVPVWEGLELIRDPYTLARRGEIALTVFALYGAAMVRNNGLQEIKVRLAA